jgi:hypothetical protein
MLIHDGITRLRLRNGFRQSDEAFMQPGNVYSAEVQLPFMDYTWKTGHAIEIILSGNHAIRWNVNPHNQTAMYTAGDTNVARITVHHNAQYPSAVMIPGQNPALHQQHALADDLPLLLYPNPAKHTLCMDEKFYDSQYEVWDMRGQCMQRGRLQNACLPLQDLPSGLYVMKVFEAEGFRSSVFQVASE